MRRAWLCLPYSPNGIFIHMDKILQSLLFSMLSSPSFLSLSLYARCSSPLVINTLQEELFLMVFLYSITINAGIQMREGQSVKQYFSNVRTSPGMTEVSLYVYCSKITHFQTHINSCMTYFQQQLLFQQQKIWICE